MIDDKIVGTIMAGHDGRRGSIQHLVVSPTAQGLGIAKTLVNQSLTALKDVGVLKSHIHVFSSNVTGQEFWTHIGWTERKDLKTFSFINSDNSNV
jgi:ribosomal protein S18 acetylase RimI-like enzyme